MEGTPKFVPFEKKEDADGLGYNISNMNGDWTYVPYERRETAEVFYVYRLDGTESELIPWPKEEDEEEFDSSKVDEEAAKEAAARAEAELAAKIVGVAENGGRKKKNRKNRKSRRDDKERDDYRINESIRIGDYTFDVKMKNAITLMASSIAAASLVAIGI